MDYGNSYVRTNARRVLSQLNSYKFANSQVYESANFPGGKLRTGQKIGEEEKKENAQVTFLHFTLANCKFLMSFLWNSPFPFFCANSRKFTRTKDKKDKTNENCLELQNAKFQIHRKKSHLGNLCEKVGNWSRIEIMSRSFIPLKLEPRLHFFCQAWQISPTDHQRPTFILSNHGYPQPREYPVKNISGTFSCLNDGSLVWFENETKSAREIPSFP